MFGVERGLHDPAAAPGRLRVERGGATKEIGVADGVAHPHGPDRLPFGQPPAVGDALYLGFEQSVARLLVQVSIEASMARGAGVNPEDPPLRWEASQGDGAWAEVEVLSDLHRRLQLRLGNGRAPVPARRRASSRSPGGDCTGCAAGSRRRRAPAASPPRTSNAPEIYQITAAPLGALLAAEHAAVESARVAGREQTVSPGETLALRFAPGARARSRRDARGPGTGRVSGRPWEQVESFAGFRARRSPLHDRPRPRRDRARPRAARARRQPQRRHGAVAPKGAALRMSRYRHGGGRIGNVAAGTLTMLRSAIPGRRLGDQPGRRPWRASTRSPCRPRASAPRSRSARATARSPPRTTSSSRPRPRRASPGRCACRTTSPV